MLARIRVRWPLCPEAVRGIPETPSIHPHDPGGVGPTGAAWGGLSAWSAQPRFAYRGLWASLLGVLGSFPLILGSERVRLWVVDRFRYRDDLSRIGHVMPQVFHAQGIRLLTVAVPGLIYPESAYRKPQVFHTQWIRLRPMILFNGVSHSLTPIVRIL